LFLLTNVWIIFTTVTYHRPKDQKLRFLLSNSGEERDKRQRCQRRPKQGDRSDHRPKQSGKKTRRQ
jgi:hypothetical protein